MSGVLADGCGIEHVFTFDPVRFRTLGFVVVPAETGGGWFDATRLSALLYSSNRAITTSLTSS
jgi:hypothetical protein